MTFVDFNSNHNRDKVKNPLKACLTYGDGQIVESKGKLSRLIHGYCYEPTSLRTAGRSVTT